MFSYVLKFRILTVKVAWLQEWVFSFYSGYICCTSTSCLLRVRLLNVCSNECQGRGAVQSKLLSNFSGEPYSYNRSDKTKVIVLYTSWAAVFCSGGQIGGKHWAPGGFPRGRKDAIKLTFLRDSKAQIIDFNAKKQILKSLEWKDSLQERYALNSNCRLGSVCSSQFVLLLLWKCERY